MKNNKGRGGGLINFLPMKTGGLLEREGLFERGGLIEDFNKVLSKGTVSFKFRFIPGGTLGMHNL